MVSSSPSDCDEFNGWWNQELEVCQVKDCNYWKVPSSVKNPTQAVCDKGSIWDEVIHSCVWGKCEYWIPGQSTPPPQHYCENGGWWNDELDVCELFCNYWKVPDSITNPSAACDNGSKWVEEIHSCVWGECEFWKPGDSTPPPFHPCADGWWDEEVKACLAGDCNYWVPPKDEEDSACDNGSSWIKDLNACVWGYCHYWIPGVATPPPIGLSNNQAATIGLSFSSGCMATIIVIGLFYFFRRQFSLRKHFSDPPVNVAVASISTGNEKGELELAEANDSNMTYGSVI